MTNASSHITDGGADPSYGSSYHVPVLCDAVVEHLITNPAGCYVDATLGGGGHAAALLDALAPAGRVIGIDQDAEALSATRARLSDAVAAGRLQVVRGNFERLAHLLTDVLELEAIDGLLLDLGVSSHQLDEADRGFSFQQEAPLDMRMDDRQGLTAHQVVNDWSEEDLREALWTYGEERAGARIARAIVDARPLDTTTALADAVRRVVPTREEVKTLARVFQGIRIAVNRELKALEAALQQAVDVLQIGGRMAVISYHSLEDRRVKRFFRHGNLQGEPRRDVYGNPVTPWNELTRKPLRASDAEIEANPRARSARLRIAERIAEPDLPAVP